MPSRAKSIQQLAAKYTKRGSGVQFSKDQIEKLLRFYRVQLEASGDQKGEGKLAKNAFRDIVHSHFQITDELIADRVARVFDQDNDSAISVDEWIRGLSVYLQGSLEDHIKFCFNVYDINNDGYISREEMFQMLKNSVLKSSTEEEPEDNIKELVEITMKQVDKDQDGWVSISDFRSSVQEESLFLEVLGQCLPKNQHKMAFLDVVDSAQ